MNENQTRPEPTQADMHSALFAQLILQQSNLAMMLMGRVAHPDSGKTIKDIEAARLFIDQLEMLEAKTRGNLSKEEDGLLKQTLMSLRLAFVEAIDSGDAQPAQPETAAAGTKSPESASPADEEHRKKFSKKY